MTRKKLHPPRTGLPDPHSIIARVNAAALPRLDGLCPRWIPGGRRMGAEFVAQNPTRTDRRAGSFKINLHTGKWADFATGDAGGDPVSLYAYLRGLPQLQAAKTLAEDLGVTP